MPLSNNLRVVDMSASYKLPEIMLTHAQSFHEFGLCRGFDTDTSASSDGSGVWVISRTAQLFQCLILPNSHFEFYEEARRQRSGLGHLMWDVSAHEERDWPNDGNYTVTAI